MAAIYDALGNYMGDDGLPEGMLNQRPTPAPAVSPPAGVAPIAGNAPFQVYPPNVMGPMPPALAVADLNPSLEDPVDVTGAPGALDPMAAYADPAMDPGALNAADVPEGVLMEPPQDEGLFSFLNKPGASDSLVAFGSAMLRGNTFGEGLANAADAVTQVAQQYRMPTPREIAIAQMKGKLAQTAQGGGGNSYRPAQVGYAPGIGYIPTRFNEGAGLTEYQLPNGTITTVMPEGFTDRVSANVGEESTFDSKTYFEDFKTLPALRKNISQFSSMIDLAPRINAGGDVFSTLKRTVNAALGSDFGADLSDVEYFEKLNNDAQLEVAQGQKGLGQFTEMERGIVARSIPNIGTQEATIIQVGARLKVQAEMKAELISDWARMSPQERSQYGGYRTYVANKLQEYQVDYERRFDEEIKRIAASRGVSNAQTTGNTSIFDEADAIVGN